MRRRIALILASALLLATAVPVAAGKPEMERIPIDDVGLLDEFLTDECGFDVFFDGSGHITFRLLSDADGNPMREVNNFAIQIRYYSEFGEVRTRDIGPDRVRYLDDGSITIAVTGNIQSFSVPGQGRVVANTGQTILHITFPEDGSDPITEVIRQAGNHTEGDSTAVICDLLDG